MSDQIISQEGFNKLKEELEDRKTNKRHEIADRIQTAKDMGDLSENAEYHQAKEDQMFNEGRIVELESTLKTVTIVEGENGDKIGMGSNVVAEANGVKKEFKIVSFNEADPLEGRISNESPLGKALVGKKKDEKVVVNTPKGEQEYRIISIS